MTLRRASRRWAVAVSAAGLLAGCVQAPPVREPVLQLPPAYRQACAVQARAAATATLDAWWHGFGDDGITHVVERALTGSPVLAQAVARAEQARAAAQAAGAQRAPRSELHAGIADVEQSLLDPVPRLGQALPGFERGFVQRQLSVGAAWDLDPAGGLRAAADAANAEALAAEGLGQAARTGLAADAAQAYLSLRALQSRLVLAQEQEAVQQRLAALVSLRVERGVAPRRDLDSAQAALEDVRAGMPTLRAGIEAEMLRLEVLMGGAPGTYRAELERTGELPEPPSIADAQSPAALLRRRPDILAAEQRLLAARARIGASLAEYYPRLSLSALLGWSSSVSGQLVTSDGLTHQAAAALRWRLFDFGRVDAEVAAARGREAEALAAYRATVWTAAAEVETAFSALLQEEERARILARQMAHLDSARGRAQAAYAEGATSLLEVLDLDRQRLSVSHQRLQVRLGVARATVNAFRALGGGWRAPALSEQHPAAECVAPNTPIEGNSP